MFEIKDNKIKVIQGDTGSIRVALDDYKLTTGDKVYFTVKKDYGETALIKKVITVFDEGVATIKLTTNDTDMPVNTYLYDIQVNLSNGTVDTIVLNKFQVLGGITTND
jgi:hypothetical protein